MERRVICNRAGDELCPGCSEDAPHKIHQRCTQWGECEYVADGKRLSRKVRCVTHKSKGGSE